MAYRTIALLAHVDAGKTTFVEQALFQSGTLKNAGRVDHKDSFLDYEDLERERGITISSKQVYLNWKDDIIQILDTPGHSDFSSEMEKNLPVIDAAVLILSASQLLTGHTQTLWDTLNRYHKPVILFVNKMDLADQSKEEIKEFLRRNFSEAVFEPNCTEDQESIALLDERLLNLFLENEKLPEDEIARLTYSRKIFPLFFGSALNGEGISELLDFVQSFEIFSEKKEFGAKVFKVTEDPKLAALRITGGELNIRDEIDGEKITQIYQIQGQKLLPIQKAENGQIIAVAGLEDPYIGQGLGFEQDEKPDLLHPFLQYELIPHTEDLSKLIPYMKKLMKEEPSLQIQIEENENIFLSMHGNIQQDVLKKKIFENTGAEVSFGSPQITLMETIKEPMIGIGHFEPLRHYAEVHVLLKPGKPGSGIRLYNDISSHDLPLGNQAVIFNLLKGLTPRGILTNSVLTDLEIHLIAAKVSKAHTSSSDLWQALRRAIRNALAKTQSQLLEPSVEFDLQVPADSLSKALFDLENRKAKFSILESDEKVHIKGNGPLRLFQNYQNELAAYSNGFGTFSMIPGPYIPSQDSKELIAEVAYDFLKDGRNPAGSIFFEHGAGYSVDFDEVEALAHIQYKDSEQAPVVHSTTRISQKTAEAVFEQAGGRNASTKNKVSKKRKMIDMPDQKVDIQPRKKTILIVDGYNMIFGWKDLKELAREDLASARNELISRVSEYAGYKGYETHIIFDAYKTLDRLAKNYRNGLINVTYTKQGQTADAYIEKMVKDLHRQYSIIAATSDGLIQNSVISHGGLRVSAAELERRIRSIQRSV